MSVRVLKMKFLNNVTMPGNAWRAVASSNYAHSRHMELWCAVVNRRFL